MKHDVFFEVLTLQINDNKFLGEMSFHHDHLDVKEGKSGIVPYRGTGIVSQVRSNFNKLEVLPPRS
jgi:hypothetical protein